MRSLLLSALFATAASGCIIYDEELVYDDPVPGTERPDDDDRPDRPTGEDPAPEEITLRLTPDTGFAGETLIVSLQADGGALGTVTGLEFFGDAQIVILASQPRTDELLLTVEIPSDAPASDNHLLVDFEDGDTLFVEDAFTVQ